jgi:hypothetical protein
VDDGGVTLQWILNIKNQLPKTQSKNQNLNLAFLIFGFWYVILIFGL